MSDGQQLVDCYEQRWVIEEYHKVLKTGCRVEERYDETAEHFRNIA